MSHTRKDPSGGDGSAGDPIPLPTDADLDGAAELVRLLADRTRLAILVLLVNNELTVGELAKTLDRPMAAVSQHLAKLRLGRLVSVRRAGTSIYCTLANEHVGDIVKSILEQNEHTLYDSPPHHY